MKIRKATINDQEIILDLFNSDTNLIGNDEIKYNENHIKEYLTNSVHIIFVYEEDNKIKGAVLIEFLRIAKYIYLDDLIINKDFKHQGIGQKLLSFVEDFAKGQEVELIFMFVEENNKIMNNFVNKNKYQEGKRFTFFSKELR